MEQFHVISGLPRSGSTLLSALLLQDPQIQASMSSPVAGLLTTLHTQMSQPAESVFIDYEQRETILRGVVTSYYRDSRPIVFDTNRGWTAKLDLLMHLFPEAKVICCVRHVPWIIDSIENLLRKNVWEASKMFPGDGGTVYSRADTMMAPGGMIGGPLNALKQAMHSKHADRILLVNYEKLALDPSKILYEIKEFCGIPHYCHDFYNVEFDAREYDARLGTPGLHDVKPMVGKVERETVLPPDLWQRYAKFSVFADPKFNGKVKIA